MSGNRRIPKSSIADGEKEIVQEKSCNCAKNVFFFSLCIYVDFYGEKNKFCDKLCHVYSI